MNHLNKTNSSGVTVREGLKTWQVQEAILCDRTNCVSKELETHQLKATLDTVWDQLTEVAKEAVSDAWCESD